MVQQGLNNTWHHIEHSSDAVLIFVHGYFSSSDRCWKSRTDVFWPDLVIADQRISPCSIFLAGFHTSLSSRDYGVADCASELMAALRRVGPNGESPVLTRQRLIFVCHSLGGIVTRYALDAYREEFESKNIGLCLFASPSIGSDYADAFGFLSELFRNRAGQQLKFLNPFLEDLDERFIRFLDGRKPGTFFGAEGVEHKPPLLSFLPSLRLVADKLSAGRYFPQRQVLPSTNHSTIVKPATQSDPGHLFLVDFLHRMNLDKRVDAQTCGDPMFASPEPIDVLFDIYESRLEPFYLVRQIDKTIAEQAKLRSVWFSGPSGTGKTCLLKRYISDHKCRQFALCLSQYGANTTRGELIREFAETFSQLTSEDVDPTYSGVSNFLDRQPEQDILIYVDEIQAGVGLDLEILKLLGDLLTNWKQRWDGRRLMFVVSSFVAPEANLLANKEKIRELFAFEDADWWSERELRALYELIVNQLPEMASTNAHLSRILEESRGSPRFLKTFFRNKKFAVGEAGQDINLILARTKDQLGA